MTDIKEEITYRILELKKVLDEITKDNPTEDIVENLTRRINKSFGNSLYERDIYEALIRIKLEFDNSWMYLCKKYSQRVKETKFREDRSIFDAMIKKPIKHLNN